MKKKIIGIIFCLLCSLLMYAQSTESDLETAEAYNAAGEDYCDKGDYESALSCFEKALNIGKTAYGEKHPFVTNLYDNIGSTLYYQGKYEQSLIYLSKALEITEVISDDNYYDVIDLSTKIGVIFYNLGKYKQALEYQKKALEISETVYGDKNPSIISPLFNLGVVYFSLNEYENALDTYRKALTISIDCFGENHSYVACSYNNIGLIFHELGDYENALKYYKKALEIKIFILGEKHNDTALTYINIGIIYQSKGDMNNALFYFFKAASIFEDIYDKNHPNVAMSYNNIGVVYDELEQYDKALEYHQKSLEIKQHFLDEIHPDIAMSYSNIGVLFFKQKDYKQAFKYYYKALEINKALYGEYHSSVAMSYFNIALLCDQEQLYEDALVFHQQSLDIRKILYGEEHPEVAKSYELLGLTYLDLKNVNSAYECFYKSLKSSQNSFAYLGTINSIKNILSQNIEDINLIETALRTGLDTAERARLDMSSMKTEVMRKSLPLYYYGVQFECSRDNSPKAFEYSEALRNRGFLEQLGTETALNLSDVTADEKNELRSLMEQITVSRSAIAKLTNAETDAEKQRYKKAGEELEEAEKALKALDEKIGKRIPAYTQLRNPQPVKAADAQKWCGDKRSVLEYVLPFYDAETGLKTGAYCLVITADDIKSVSLDSEFDYIGALTELRSAVIEKHQNLSAGSIASIHKYRTVLYEKLIEPVLQYIPSDTEKLLIVPDGNLSSLPFDILGKFDEKLLGERYSLSFSPSVSVSMLKEKYSDKKISLLGIGNAVYTGGNYVPNSFVSEYYAKLNSSWKNLKYTEKELNNLKILVSHKDRVDIFEQENATEKLIKELSQSGKLADYNQILIACHGYFNAEKPEMSTLVFSEVSGTVKDSTEDGYLTVDELALLKMNAKFLNLSACQTGLVSEKQGDGMTGLTRSCIIAGSENVGVTLWEVNDNATCMFQEYLYGFIKDGMSYPDAYQTAKEKMKSSEYWSNPEYWAGFVLYE